MPLGKKVESNIKELYHANAKKDKAHKRSRDQIIAITMSAAGKSKIKK